MHNKVENEKYNSLHLRNNYEMDITQSVATL